MRYLITSALPYVHGVPHLGNFVGSVFPADVTARFLRLKGEETLFICGSDMHGSPLEVAAFKAGKDVKEMAYENHKRIKELFEKYHVSTDYYGHTDSEANKKITYDLFFALLENGYIKEEKVTMAFCKGHKGFLADRWIEGECPYCGGLARGDQCDDCGAVLTPEEIKNPKCVYCGSKDIEFKETKHLVIDLPKLEKELKDFYEKKGKNWPKNAKNITEYYLYKTGLKPRSITRHLKFGFPVPLEGYEDQVFYVWFDAPIGYIGITAEYTNEWEKWWKGKDVFLIQYMGKDNIFFHTILWPAILIGSEKGFVLPDFIASSEYLKAKDVKFSKSRGIGLNLESALEVMPPDYWRYVLAALYPGRRDMEFSWEIVEEKIDKELVGNIGNFVYRVLTLWHRKYGENITGKIDKKEFEKIVETVNEIEKKYLEWIEFQEVVRLINKLAYMGNHYLNVHEPWKMEDPKDVLYTALHYVKALAIAMAPITPVSSDRIMEMLGFEGYSWGDAKKEGIKEVKKPEILFRKVGEKIKGFKKKFSEEKEEISIKDFEKAGLKVGIIKHVQEIKEDDERMLLVIDFNGKTYRAAPGIKKVYAPEDLKGRPVLFFEIEERIVHGVKINAYVPLAAGKIITNEKGIQGKVA